MAASDDNEFFLIAPAKVNLLLDVDTVLVEGRHRVQTIMQAISLCDHIHAKVDRDPSEPGIDLEMVETHGLGATQLAPEDNLVYKAVLAYLEAMGEPLAYRFEITIEKSVPPQSGLGGGSSDCAAAIALMARIFGHDPCGDIALAVARSLGTDIAFFLHGGCALLDGYGDCLVEELPAPELDLVVVRPQMGLNTGVIYRAYDERNALMAPAELEAGVSTMSQRLSGLAEALRAGGRADEVARCIGNSLQAAAFAVEPAVAEVRALLDSQPGVVASMLSGSGSAVFAICAGEDGARSASAAMEAAGLWSVTCKSVSFGAGVGDSL